MHDVYITAHKYDMQAFVLGKIGKTLAINFERIGMYEGKIVSVEADRKDA
jgi:hypothetical protein